MHNNNILGRAIDVTMEDDKSRSEHDSRLPNNNTRRTFEDYVNYVTANAGSYHNAVFDQRINDFMLRHADMSYKQFVNQAHPEAIQDNSYGLFSRPSIRRSLFESRSIAYLDAMCDFEAQGGDINDILDDIRTKFVPTIKKSSGHEPTFEKIYEVLKKH